MKFGAIIAILISIHLQSYAQVSEEVAGYVQLDSVVVLAQKDGFEREDFIRWMQEDTSLYEAFRRLRRMNYSFTTDWAGSYSNGKKPAVYHARCRQTFDGQCRSMQLEDESVQGPVFRKNRNVRYYTLAMLMDLFYTPAPVCTGNSNPPGDAGKSNRISQLKEIIFNPGSGYTIPLIGRKFELFSERMSPWYQYAWYPRMVDGERCFVFAIRLNESAPGNKAIVQSMVTYFRQEDLQVVYRSYHLKQQGLVIFENKIQISLRQNEQGEDYPALINYTGNWNLPGKRGETGTFELHIMPTK